MRARAQIILVVSLLCLALSSASQAQLTPYSQDFEGLVQSDPDALSNDGWLVFGNVSDTSFLFLYQYGAFTAPNTGGQAFGAIVTGQGGPPQGTQQLSVYNDYANGSGGHADSYFVEALIFQEQVIAAADVGSTWTFEFDHKLGNIEGGSSAVAFIKTLDPNAGYATTGLVTADMSAIPITWQSTTLSILIDASLVGQLLQFGFASTATNFEGSGIYYDNVRFRPPPPPAPPSVPMAGPWGLLVLMLILSAGLTTTAALRAR